MNYWLQTHSALTGCFLFCIVICGITDYKERRIPNKTVFIMLIIAVLSLIIRFNVGNLIAAGLMLLLLPFYAKGHIAGGDVKLLFVSALYFGLLGTTIILILQGIAVGIYKIFNKKKGADRIAMGIFFAPVVFAFLIIKELTLL